MYDDRLPVYHLIFNGLDRVIDVVRGNVVDRYDDADVNITWFLGP